MDEMVTVKVRYPGMDHIFHCTRQSALFLIAQFERNEWIEAEIVSPPEPPEQM